MSDKKYKQYTVSFYGKQYTSKPKGKVAAQISNKLATTSLTYDFLANRVGEKGCSFAPGVLMAPEEQSIIPGSNSSPSILMTEQISIPLRNGQINTSCPFCLPIKVSHGQKHMKSSVSCLL